MQGDDILRLDETIARLAPHLAATPFALTGGIAIDFHLVAARRTPSREHIADLDLVVGRLDAIAPAVTADFLISHYHTTGPDTKPMLQLVDPRTRLRIDLFPDTDGALDHATRIAIGRTGLLVLSVRSILEHKVRVLRTSTPARPVDPKHLSDAKVLADIARMVIPPLRPALAPQTYSTDVDARCARCERSRTPAFSLAPKAEIFALLGSV